MMTRSQAVIWGVVNASVLLLTVKEMAERSANRILANADSTSVKYFVKGATGGRVRFAPLRRNVGAERN